MSAGMPAELPLALLAPAATVGVAIAWRNEDGTLGISWRDVKEGIPVERATAARLLRILADALDTQAAEVDGS